MRSELGKITLDKTFEERDTLNVKIVVWQSVRILAICSTFYIINYCREQCLLVGSWICNGGVFIYELYYLSVYFMNIPRVNVLLPQLFLIPSLFWARLFIFLMVK
jgi:hypothetical protein